MMLMWYYSIKPERLPLEIEVQLSLSPSEIIREDELGMIGSTGI